MGKKGGKTKAGRSINPADRERKKERAKELKKNKKTRTQVRQAAVKSKDPEEILAQLRRLDDQDLDPNSEFSKHVIADKRSKCKTLYLQQLALYRQDKDENTVTRMEAMFQSYEGERRRKEQQYQALMFSDDMNLGEIPLPCGSLQPDAHLTPFVPPPPMPPRFDNIPSTTSEKPKADKRQPPGPPCGVPPSFDEDLVDINRPRRTQVFAQPEPEQEYDEDYDIDDDDMGPVEMPDELLAEKSSFQPVRSMISAPIIPPNMAPPPPPMPPTFNRGYQEHMPPNYNNAPPASYVPPMRQPPSAPRPSYSNHPSSTSAIVEAVISAAPQMRNFKKETTKFVPASLQVRRPNNQPKPKAILRHPIGQVPTQVKPANVPGKSADETCDEFLREISDLL